MDCHLSTSIKVGGVPLLPPLITNNIFTEIQYYKQLAVAVQERLRALETAKQALDKNQNQSIENDIVSAELLTMTNKQKSESSANSMNLISLEDNSTKENVYNLIDIDTPTTDCGKEELLINVDFNSEPRPKKLNQSDKSVSDEDKSCLNETVLAESVNSDTVTASTDLNQYFNISASSRADTIETSETTPENFKPKVPNTLNIVPITLDQSKSNGEKLSTDSDGTPKLVRQGSYVLDSPSPMLLAHMQNEPTNSASSSTQSIQGKVRNNNKTKPDLKNKGIFKEPIPSRPSSLAHRFRKNSGSLHQKISKSVSNSKTNSPLDVYRPAKSVDCIQAMFAKEYSKTVSSKYGIHAKKSSSVYSTNGLKTNEEKKNKNISILNLANKISSSLGSLSNNNDPKPVKRLEKKKNQETQPSTDVNSNFKPEMAGDSSNLLNKEEKEAITPDTSDSSSEPSKKERPFITSETVIDIFKEVQETYKKQMLELMTRQQNEQILMQDKFRKQQILLLAHIRQAFPEIPISTLSEAISGKKTDKSETPSPESPREQSHFVSKNTQVPKINGMNQSDKNKKTTSDLLVDYQDSSRESSTSASSMHQTTPPHPNNPNATRTLDSTPNSFVNRFDLSNVRDIDEIPVGNLIRKHSAVSRQLFPYDRIHYPPQIDTSRYTESHFKAATTINAYAKGFLVRRLMKTEKVIALKNTYREALHCMLKLHVEAPLTVPEMNFHRRLQLQCDAASESIVDLFAQNPSQRMEIIAHDREIKKARAERPNSARSSYSFATQRTLERKKMKESGAIPASMTKSCPARTRCLTWESKENMKQDKKMTTSLINHGMKRSTSAGAVRKPWR